MRKILLVLPIVFVVLASPLWASEKYTLGKGNHRFAPSLSISRNFGSTGANISLDYGYFVTDWLQPETGFDFSFGNGFDSEAFMAGASVFYNKGQILLPFIGLGIGVVSVAIDGFARSTSFITAPKFGVVVPIRQNVAISVYLEYQRWSGGETGIAGTNHLFAPFGFSVFF